MVLRFFFLFSIPNFTFESFTMEVSQKTHIYAPSPKRKLLFDPLPTKLRCLMGIEYSSFASSRAKRR